MLPGSLGDLKMETSIFKIEVMERTKKKLKIEWLIFSLIMFVVGFWSLRKLSSRKEPCANLLSACSAAGYIDDLKKK